MNLAICVFKTIQILNNFLHHKFEISSERNVTQTAQHKYGVSALHHLCETHAEHVAFTTHLNMFHRLARYTWNSASITQKNLMGKYQPMHSFENFPWLYESSFSRWRLWGRGIRAEEAPVSHPTSWFQHRLRFSSPDSYERHERKATQPAVTEFITADQHLTSTHIIYKKLVQQDLNLCLFNPKTTVLALHYWGIKENNENFSSGCGRHYCKCERWLWGGTCTARGLTEKLEMAVEHKEDLGRLSQSRCITY